MRKGDSIKVKQGTLDPDLNQFDMSGWQGRITAITTHKKLHLIEVAWDSLTLKQLPEAFIENSIAEGYDYSIMTLEEKDVEPAKPRDKESDVEKQLKEIGTHYAHSAFDEQEKRIAKLLSDNDLSVTAKNQNIYLDYLQNSIQKGTILTGTEDFPWEEKYVLGGWSKKEYEELKKTQPSYTDKFELMKFLEDIDDMYGIMAKVKRATDKKQFVLPLSDLECTDKNAKEYELIRDYSFWMTNYS